MKKSNNLEVKLEGEKLGDLISGLLDGEYGVRKAEDSSNILEIYAKLPYSEKIPIGTVFGKIKLKKKEIVCYVDEAYNQKDKIMNIIYWAKTIPQ
ncbi:hypothetical protein FJZ53_05820 [Candidatus Woesearchaeota archaeon]|nr:hypothetical protein [Candidatus Woesearchaeota archaeon]